MSNYSKFQKKDLPSGPLSIGGTIFTRDMLSPGQKELVKAVDKWLGEKKKTRKPILRIGAGSGFGKSVCIKYLVDHYGWDLSECYVVSYTGQSVNVLKTYGVRSGTIHATFMTPQDVPVLDKESGKPIIRRGIPLMDVRFVPVKAIPPTVKLIIIDEASFLPKSLEDLLVRYNTPILEIGDPIQLPPVTGQQVFREDTLDYFFEGVMRQNADSEIYKLGTLIRKMNHVLPEDYGNEVRFLQQEEYIEDTFMRYLPMFRDADAIVVSNNKQRQVITDLYRKHVLKTDSPYPIKGERMICRRNNAVYTLGEFMLTNGMQGTCLHKVGRSAYDSSTDTFFMDFQPDVVTDDYFDDLMCDATFLKKPFGTDDLTSYHHLGNKFEFAHAITVHLCQGASFNKVVYMDSMHRDQEFLYRKRYTAVTRARQKLWYMIPYNGRWSL